MTWAFPFSANDRALVVRVEALDEGLVARVYDGDFVVSPATYSITYETAADLQLRGLSEGTIEALASLAREDVVSGNVVLRTRASE